MRNVIAVLVVSALVILDPSLFLRPRSAATTT